MKKAGPIIVVVVLVLVVLFGVGQFFIASNQTSVTGSTSASATPPVVLQPTQIVEYVPPAPVTSTPVMKGSCWTSSIAAPYRSDAWRCSVGNSIQDPCFQILGSNNLLCGVNPAISNATSTFVLQLTQALPAPEAIQGTVPTDWAWLVELPDGTLCSPFTGTRPFSAQGDVANYGCAPGPLGNDINIFGDFNTSTTQWMAEIGTLSNSTSTFPPPLVASSEVPVATIWQ